MGNNKPQTLADILASLNVSTPNTNTNTPSVDVPIQDVPVDETPKPIKVAKPTPSTAPNKFASYPFASDFQRNLRKFELWFGNPSTGKTTYAKRLAQQLVDDNNISDYTILNCHEDMTVMSLFKTTKTDDQGTWKFILNKAFQMLTDELQQRYVIIFDEINTLAMSVLKALQPILDDTEGMFEFEDKVYRKNPNVWFIATMNHKDLGTSTLPDAVKSRAFPKFFKDLSYDELAQRTLVPATFIDILKRIYDMFKDMGNLHPFYNDVRQLKNMVGLTPQAFREYVIAQLELAQIDYETVINVSPEFDNLINEFANIQWGKGE